MKISTKGRYAVRCMLNLAVNQTDGSVSVSKIAEQEKISSNYIEQLFLKLKEKNLVKSVRGRSGGYKLAGAPGKITMAQVIEAVEGPIVAVDCVRSRNCERYEGCITKYLWELLSDKIKEALDKTTLQDLLDIARDKMSPRKHRHTFNI